MTNILASPNHGYDRGALKLKVYTLGRYLNDIVSDYVHPHSLISQWLSLEVIFFVVL